jgi:glycogen debranching enzyme
VAALCQPAGDDDAVHGKYRHAPDWYRNFLYTEEAARGLDCIEDLAAPGVFSFDIGSATLPSCCVQGSDIEGDARSLAAETFARERKRRSPLSRMDRAADAYVVSAGTRRTIIAGYPWFTDWGRDTFIAMRGLLLSRGRADIAADDPRGLVGARVAGHAAQPLPRRQRAAAVQRGRRLAVVRGRRARDDGRRRLRASGCRARIDAIVDGYARARASASAWTTTACSRAASPACSSPGWMRASDGRVITPRIGKPVEVQALWINALRLAGGRTRAAGDARRFAARFVDRQARPYDVVDADHVAGRVDASVRPNQVFAVGGLPFASSTATRARRRGRGRDASSSRPPGSARSRDPTRYCARYEGGPAQRDGAYHQGTVWPWLMGRSSSVAARARKRRRAKAQARQRFVAPLAARVGARASITCSRSPTATRRTRRAVPVPGVVARRAHPRRRR